MTHVSRTIAQIERLLVQSVARGTAYRARLDAAKDAKEIFIATTLRAREIKVYRRLMNEKAQLEALPVNAKLGWDCLNGVYRDLAA